MNSTALPGGTLVLLLFTPCNTEPQYVMRMPRDPHKTGRQAQNYNALEQMQRYTALKGTVPTPVTSGDISGLPYTVESCLRGSHVARELLNSRLHLDQTKERRLLEAGANWLSMLHGATASGATHPIPSAQAVQYLGTTGVLSPRDAAALTRKLGSISQGTLPTAICHGDYNPNNLLWSETDQATAVFDFEYSSEAIALFDLFEWFRTAAVMSPGLQNSEVDRLNSLFDPDSPAGTVFLPAANPYIKNAGLHPSALRPLFNLYLTQLTSTVAESASDPHARHGRHLLAPLAGILTAEANRT